MKNTYDFRNALDKGRLLEAEKFLTDVADNLKNFRSTMIGGLTIVRENFFRLFTRLKIGREPKEWLRPPKMHIVGVGEKPGLKNCLV